MTYKNAGITSKKEAAQRLIDGEVFYWKGRELKFFEHKNQTPFREEQIDLKTQYENYMTAAWAYVTDWQVKVNWYEDIPEHGVLCKQEFGRTHVITHIDEKAGKAYMNAVDVEFILIEDLTPLSDKEIDQFKRGG